MPTSYKAIPKPERRRGDRSQLPFAVRCLLAQGKSPEAWLTEISPTGCQLKANEGLLMAGQFIVIKVAGLEGLPGAVRWSLGETAGVQFEQPLHEAIVRHLLYAPSGETYGDSFVDRFGRRLPNRSRNVATASRPRTCG